jgi:hypothetical protein
MSVVYAGSVDAKAQRRKGAKRCRGFRVFFAPLRLCVKNIPSNKAFYWSMHDIQFL